jgi:hypothetical protein
MRREPAVPLHAIISDDGFGFEAIDQFLAYRIRVLYTYTLLCIFGIHSDPVTK